MEESNWSENKHLKEQATILNLGMGSVFSEKGFEALKKFIDSRENEEYDDAPEIPLDRLNDFINQKG